MAEIFNFIPQNSLDANKNLEQFIYECRYKLTVFGEDLIWSSWRWPKVHFTKLGANSKAKNIATKLDEQFIDFAKAYCRYQQGHHETGTKNEMMALRAIEAGLIQMNGNAKIENIDISVLDETALIIRNHYSPGAAYHAGRELERLATFLSRRKLISRDLQNWKNPIVRKRDEIQTGLEAKLRREKKLPTDVALNALAEIFANNPSDPKDIFTSAVFALLMSAPSRISEVLDLPVDCEIEELDSKGVLRYGIRFYSGKGYGGNIKWIPTEMVGIAKEAIRRIRELTEEPRKLAVWVEENPTTFYHHATCPELQNNSLLTAMQVCAAIGLKAENLRSARSNLLGMKLDNRDCTYSLDTLWKYVMSRQPKGFPWLNKSKGIKYSNALFCMTRNLLGSQRSTSPVILWAPKNNGFNNDLSPRYSLKRNHKSIFDRYGYKSSDNQRVKLTSHQARHLLNTMAQRGGLSQLEIAKWSGRADPNQNRTYNHMSEFELVMRAEQMDPSLSLFGPAGSLEMKQPVSIQEFNLLEKGALHVTEYGFCVHDFVMSQCDKHRDCLNCSEHVCLKGDVDNLERIKEQYKLIEEQYNAAEKAMNEGYSGADRWYEYHKKTKENLTHLINILESKDVEDGAQIKLNGNEYSPLLRAVETKLNKQFTSDKILLQDMKTFLGGGLG